MLAQIIGTFDFPSMLVIAGPCVGMGIALAAWFARTPPRISIMKLQNEHQETLLKLGNSHQERLAAQGQNLITSHSSRDSED